MDITNISFPFQVGEGNIPVDALLSVGGDSMNASVAALKTTYWEQLWNGMRVLDITTGIRHKLMYLGGTNSASAWSDIEEKERVVVVNNISDTNITSLNAAPNTAFLGDGAFSVSDTGCVFLLNAQTTTSENGYYLAKYLSASQIQLTRHTEYLGDVTTFQRTCAYNLYDGHTYRFKAGSAAMSNVYEIDDYINNGVITRSGTSLSTSGSLAVAGALSSDTSLAVGSGFTVAANGTTAISQSLTALYLVVSSANVGVAISAAGGGIVSGSNTVAGGYLKLHGATSGNATISVAAVAGTNINFRLPTTNGANGYVLQSDGSGNTSWTSKTAGTVTSVAVSGANGIAVSGSPITSAGTIALSIPNLTTGNGTFSGDVAIEGGDLTTLLTSTFNLLNANVTTINAFGAATEINIGAETGITTIRNFAKPSLERNVVSASSWEVDFNKSNVHFKTNSQNFTVTIAQSAAQLLPYSGGSFIIGILNVHETDDITVTFTDSVLIGVHGTSVVLPHGTGLAYTGWIIEDNLAASSANVYGTVAPIAQNLMTT